MNIIKKFFSTEYMLKPEMRLGEIMPSKVAYKTFWLIAWPAILESMVVSLTGIVDMLMVSRLGSGAIAAIGLTTQPRMLLYTVFIALTSGVVAVVSRRYGEGDREGADKCLAQSLVICLSMFLVILLFALLFAKEIMYFAGAKEDTIEASVVYFRITMVGIGFFSLCNVVNAAQRGVGKTKIAMQTSVIANVVNIILNFFLINGIWIFPRLEVAGAAYATLIGNIAACSVAFLSLVGKDKYLSLRPKYFLCFEKENLNALFHVASGSATEQIAMRIGFFMFAKVVADLGTTAMATHQICMNVIGISFACGDGLGVAAATLVGQNLGMGRPDCSMIYGKTAQRIGLFFSVGLFAFFNLFGGGLMSLFSDEEIVVTTGANIMRVIAVVSLVQVSQVIFSGSLRGAGDTKFNAVVSVVSITILRPVVAFLLCHTLGYGVIGAWFALLLDQSIRTACSTIHFYRGKWKSIKL